jgi:hypothetical protein
MCGPQIVQGQECVDIYVHSTMRLHVVVPYWLSAKEVYFSVRDCAKFPWKVTDILKAVLLILRHSNY